MGLRSILFAVGLGTLSGGCRTAIGKLPDSSNAIAAFSPDGREIYVLLPHRLYSWDLQAKRIAHERRIDPDQAGVAFSPTGNFVALAAQGNDDRRIFLSLIRGRDGETVFRREVQDAEVADHWYTRRTQDILALTDDGRWLAAFRLDERNLEIVSVPDGRAALRAPLAGYFRSLGFDARGQRLFASSEAGTRYTVQIVVQAGGQWRSGETLEGAFHPSWTGQGLSFGSSRGIEMWNGAQPRVVFAIDPQLQLQPDANEPSWRFSPDGAHCVLWTQTSFSVRETASGATLVTREVDSKGTPAVWAVAFPPGRIRAFLATGDLVDVDLGARSVSKRASFGRPGKYSRNWLQEGASWEGRYSALLSPDGRYVAIYKRDTGYEIYLTD